MEGYRTVAEEAQDEFTEKKSVFIGTIAPADTPQAAEALLARVRERHGEATHHVWACLLRGGAARCSDDGEPSGTAGRPVLEVLQREGLTDCAAVVTRYFGGILLGAGGLTRAYARAARLAVDAARIVEMKPAAALSLSLPYDLYGRVRFLLPSYGAADVQAAFSDRVELTLVLEESRVPAFSDALREMSAGQAAPRVVSRLFRAFP